MLLTKVVQLSGSAPPEYASSSLDKDRPMATMQTEDAARTVYAASAMTSRSAPS